MLYFICLLPLIVGAIVFGLSRYLLWRSRWFIDPVNGSDRNHGHSVKRALKTHAECMRRIRQPINALVTIDILADMDESLGVVDVQFGKRGILAYRGSLLVLPREG